MGIILQVLGLVITFTMAMEALRRFGIDVGWLNPITFFRRRAWRKKVELPAVYALQHPVDVVGVMALATVQATGAVSSAQKAGVLGLLREQLSLDEKGAMDLWVASSHLLRSRALAASEVAAVLEPCADKFSAYHQGTLVKMMKDASALEPPPSAEQLALIQAVEQFFEQRARRGTDWKS